MGNADLAAKIHDIEVLSSQKDRDIESLQAKLNNQVDNELLNRQIQENREARLQAEKANSERQKAEE